MGFFIKDFASITASMLNWMRAAQKRVTDMRVGTVHRTILEAAAQEIDTAYQQFLSGIRDAMRTGTYRTFEFDLLDPTAAVGFIRVTITPIDTDTLISAGSVFGRLLGGNVQYIAQADVMIAATDTYADVPVAADTAGATGNIASGTEFTLSPQPLAFLSATALGGITGGTDGEQEDQRQARFRDYIKALQRATDDALIVGAKQAVIRNTAGVVTERVTAVKVITPYRDVDDLLYTPGLVWLYIETRTGAPSPDLIARCQAIIDGYVENGVRIPGYKAAGAQVDVRAATRSTVPVTGEITVADGCSADDGEDGSAGLITLAEAAIADYIAGLDIAAPLLMAEMISRVMAIEGMVNIVFSAPSSDVVPAATTKLAPGTITVTEAEA